MVEGTACLAYERPQAQFLSPSEEKHTKCKRHPSAAMPIIYPMQKLLLRFAYCDAVAAISLTLLHSLSSVSRKYPGTKVTLAKIKRFDKLT